MSKRAKAGRAGRATSRGVPASAASAFSAASDPNRSVEHAVRALPQGSYLLAVSGGRDSMALLDAFARWRADACAVATFDHGTGPVATAAAELVEAEATVRGLAVVSGKVEAGTPTEAAWRAARWRFLGGWARELGARVVTAHTRDDQLETVVIRALRGAGARGLAAMYAPSPIARPLLDVPRAVVAAYAAARDVRWAEDPSNAARAHLRNRVRLDLLPAFERAQPGFGAAMLDLSRRAARWRADVEALVDSLLPTTVAEPVAIPDRSLAGLPADALAVLWQAIAGRAGIALDWRGTERLAAFTNDARAGQLVPLSGGARVRRTATSFVVEGASHANPTILSE